MVSNQRRSAARGGPRIAGLALIAAAGFACATSDRPGAEARTDRGVVDPSLAKDGEAQLATGVEPGLTPRRNVCDGLPPPPRREAARRRARLGRG